MSTRTLLLLATLAISTLVVGSAAGQTTIPGTGGSQATPAVVAPATCTQAPCASPTSTGPVNTPGVDQCIPSVPQCLLHPTIDPVHVSDGVTAPAICASPAAAACQPQTTVLPAGFVVVQYGVATTTITPPGAGVGTIEDVVLVDQPPVHLVACDNTPCPYPNVTEGSLVSGVTLIVTVNGDPFGGSFPLVV